MLEVVRFRSLRRCIYLKSAVFGKIFFFQRLAYGQLYTSILLVIIFLLNCVWKDLETFH